MSSTILALVVGCDAGSVGGVHPAVDPRQDEPLLEGSDPDPEYPPVEPADPCEGDPACVNLGEVKPLWTFEEGWSINGGLRWSEARDMNGDGLLDVYLWVVGPDGDQSLVVYGPLVRERVLPRDADVWFTSGAVVAWPADGTGDGVPDWPLMLIDEIGAAQNRVVPGPVSGKVDPWAAGLPPLAQTFHVVDYDGDGTLDCYDGHSVGGTFQGWTGPITECGVGEPDLRVIDDDAGPDPGWMSVTPWLDYDFDGVLDLCLGLYVMPRGTVGEVHLGEPPTVAVDGCATPIGDQNGDGVTDYTMSGRLYAGPLTFAPETGSVTSPQIVPTSVVESWGCMQADFDLDGIDDFWSVRFVGPTGFAFNARMYTGGVSGGLSKGESIFTFGDPGGLTRGILAESDAGYLVFDTPTGVGLVRVYP